MSLSEIKYLLEDAGKNLNFIKSSYVSSLEQSEVSIALRLKIKHFLEDVKSSLDYMGFYIFTEYCSRDLPQKKIEDLVQRVYFPNKKEKDTFDIYIKKYYPGLIETHPRVVSIFESVQSFTDIKWYATLNDLVNKNKHRYLTKQRVSHKAEVRHMQVAGMTFTNCVFENNGTDIMINDTPINIRDYKSNPYVTSLDATVTYEFFFSELNLSVLPTLDEIYSETISIINAIENEF